MTLFFDKKEVTISHELWGAKSSILPLQKAFRSTLCISVAALLIQAPSVSAAVKSVDLNTSTQNVNPITKGSTGSPINTSLSNVTGLEISNTSGNDGTFDNDGDISLYYTANINDFDLVGVSTLDSSITLDNLGDITLEVSKSNSFYGKYQSVGAIGIEAEGDIDNNGTITVTSKSSESYNDVVAEAVGIKALGDVSNSGTITVTASSSESYNDAVAEAVGIGALSDVSNSGTITVMASSGESYYDDSEAEALGIYAYGNVTNSGTITVTASSSDAYNDSEAEAVGIMSYGGTNNTGDLNVTATSANSAREDSEADATGILAFSGGVDNSGKITVTATSANATADESYADATGINSLYDVVDNSGNITVTSTSGEAYYESFADAAGINSNADVINSSTITVKATSGEAHYYSYAETVGIDTNGDVINTGAITVTATSGEAYYESDAEAIGIDAFGMIDNSGTITVTATSSSSTDEESETDASGIVSYIGVNNSGKIDVTATSANSTYDDSEADATGIESYGEVDNSGTITVTATSANSIEDESEAFATGIIGKNVVTNSASITVTATAGNGNDSSFALATGITTNDYYYQGSPRNTSRYIPYKYGGDVTNTESITVTANGGNTESGNSNTIAMGISANGYVENSGIITVTASGSDSNENNYTSAIGIRASNYSMSSAFGIDEPGNSSNVVNSEAITVTASGGGYDNQIHAAGISSYGSVDNSGDITVSTNSRDGSEYNYTQAVGIEGFGKVSNSGTIAVTAKTGSGTGNILNAYGIFMPNGGVVDSSGLIDVAVTAGSSVRESLSRYQIYGGGGTTTITGFAMEFGGSQDELDARYEGVISADSASGDLREVTTPSVSFSDEAILYVYANNKLENGENEYTIPALLESDADSEIERGYFAGYEMKMASPDYEVLSLSKRSDSELQVLSIKYDPQVSTPQYAAAVKSVLTRQSIGIAKSSMTNPILNYMLTGDPIQIGYEGVRLASVNPLADTSSIAHQEPRKKGSIFAQPYYTNTSNSSRPMGYDADIYGISAGYNYHGAANMIIGFNLGFGKADIDYEGIGYDQRTEDIAATSIGVQAISRFSDNWLFTGTSTFFYTENDYADQLATNRETATYNTHGVETNLNLGYIFNRGNSLIIPEIGLTHLWQHNDEYTTDNLDNSDITYGSLDENEVYASLAINWFGRYVANDWTILPNVKVGIEQTLTDGDFSNSMTAGTAVQTVTYSDDDTSAIVNAGVEFKNDIYSLSVGYNGSYSSDIADSTVFLQALMRF